LWDVDGDGLAEIEDDNVARKILQKMNAANAKTAAAAFATTAAYVFLVPEF